MNDKQLFDRIKNEMDDGSDRLLHVELAIIHNISCITGDLVAGFKFRERINQSVTPIKEAVLAYSYE